MTTITTPAAKLPAGLVFKLTDIEHGHAITARVTVATNTTQTGGSLDLAFWSASPQAALVIHTLRGSGGQPFYLRGVGYDLRAEYQRVDGAWSLKLQSCQRADWVKVADMEASRPARRDLGAILAEVGRRVVDECPDLFQDAEVSRLRGNAQAAAATVQRLERELAEARVALREADVALTLGKVAREAQS